MVESQLPLISVIIPVYNVEEYIEECLKSVVIQSYEHLEIILVDDGSTDSSGEICDQWARSDSRIRVIHQENGGLSAARNSGMKIAGGAYIGFVDSDDVIHPLMYEKLYRALTDHECDISCCGVTKSIFFEDRDKKENFRIFQPQDAILALIEDRDLSVTVWNKLYRHEIVRTLAFKEGKCHEDEYWTYQAFSRAEKIVLTDFCGYGYRQRESGIMGRKYSLKRLDIIEARSERLNVIEEHYPELTASARCDFRFECIRAFQLSLLYLDRDDLQKSRSLITRAVKKHVLRYGDYSHLPVGRKVWCFLSNISLEGTARFRNLIHFGP
ncbi:MAG: glycosyltransferase family 2 protein [Lachnospiraceae bacterium]